MIQKTLGLLLGLYLLCCQDAFAQTAEEKQAPNGNGQTVDNPSQQGDSQKPSIKQIEIGATAPELKNEQGTWINRATPVSEEARQLTLIVFDTVW